MNSTRLLAIFSFIIFCSSYSFSQCEEGEIELQMNLYTDGWGYEIYWELIPSGNECGDGTIEFGGNDLDVGCTGGGENDAGANGYDNNSMYTSEAHCFMPGTMLDLIFVDDYGDGGLTVEVYEDGILTHFYVGGGNGNVWTFEIGNAGIPSYDSPCGAEPLLLDAEVLVINNENAIASVGEVSPGGGNCALYGVWCEGNVTNSIWAEFIPETTGNYVFSTCHGETVFDTQMALWSASDCGDQTTFELVTANDDQLGGCDAGNVYASTMYADCLQEGVSYFVQIDGWNGATGDAGLTVNLYEEEQTLQAFVNNIPCFVNKGEEGNGSILPYIVGAGANFTSTWTGPDGFEASTNSIFNLNTGTYELIVVTACGETLTAEYDITMPGPISTSLEVIEPECPGSTNGEITLVATGGSEPFEVLWTGPDGFESESFNIEDAVVGNYNYVLSDDNGCEVEQSFTLNALENFSFSLGADTIICVDDELILSGPAGYDYEWQDGDENQFIVVSGTELGTGTYTYILTASNDDGCSFSDAILVTIHECSSITDVAANQLKIFPNPATDQLTIQNSEEGILSIIDLSGRVVFTENLTSNTSMKNVDISQLSAGQYLVELKGNQHTFKSKLVKIN